MTWVISTSAGAVDPIAIGDAAKAFGARPTAYAADLSPDGTKVLYLTGVGGAQTAAVLLDVATLHKKVLVKSSGKPEQLSGCDFVNDRWAVCSFFGNVNYMNLVLPMRRTILLDLQTGQIKSLAVSDSAETGRVNQFDGRVIDFLPDENGALLMQRTHPEQNNAIGVDRIEVEPFKVRTVEQTTGRADYFMTDGHGEVRFSSANDSDVDNMLTGRTSYRYRLKGSRQWVDFPQPTDDFAPMLVDRATNSLFYLDKLDGRQALFRTVLDGSNKPILVGRNASVDIDGPIRLYTGGPVVGYRYTDDRSRSVYTDPEAAKLATSLERALPGAPLIDIVGSVADRQKLLVFASGDTDPGAFYVLDRKTREMKSVLEARDSLRGIALAPVKSVTIKTHDGASIPAYITAAADAAPAGRPVVIVPHGGPSSRDEWGFDWLAQFLAARGYTVIQPNYRGSAGYGDEFLGDNAFKGWRLAMSDIHDVTDWAISSKLADPSRLAIVGWSYGGYAALQSASMDSRYKAVVAIAPVTDLGALRRDSEGFTDAALAKDQVGKGPHLKEGSPLRNAEAIKAPVLLVHGGMDSNVRFAHSDRMERALKKVGTPVQLLAYKPLDHQLNDSDARVEMLTKMGELLDRTIGH